MFWVPDAHVTMLSPSQPLINLQDAQRRQPPGQADVPSPCVSVCKMNRATGLCRGCHRTLDEIAGWGALDNSARLAVWQRIEARQLGG